MHVIMIGTRVIELGLRELFFHCQSVRFANSVMNLYNDFAGDYSALEQTCTIAQYDLVSNR